MAKKTAKKARKARASPPRPPSAKKSALTPAQAKFLAAYAVAGNLTAAARAAGACRGEHYKRWIKQPAYAEAFEDAKEQAIEALEAEARRRATEGLVQYKFHEGRPLKHPVTGEPYCERNYSDTLLIFLLKAANPAKYRENVKHEHSGKIELPVLVVEVERDAD